MVDRKSWSSSEGNFSDKSDSDLVNLYDSDEENSLVLVEQSVPRPYQFEPGRVRQNEQQEASPEPSSLHMTTTRTVLETQTGIESFAIKLHF